MSAAALSVAGLRGEGSGRAVFSLDDVRGRFPPTNPVARAPRVINSTHAEAGELPNQCRGVRAHHSPQLSAGCCLEAACRRPGSGCCPCAASPPLQTFGAAPGSCKYSPTAPRCCQKACRSAACTSDREFICLSTETTQSQGGDSPLDLVLERGRVAILCLRLRGLTCLEWAFIQNAFHLEVFLSAQAQVSASSFARRDDAFTFPSDALICTRCG